MSRHPAPKTRNLEILHSIVQEYIETGEPVASRAIARRLNDRLSSASIRNTMADLEDEGYLAQPHTSAGRVPTGKAFQSYVQSLSEGRVLAAELARLREELSHVESVPARVERSSHLLTEMTRGLGIAAAIPTPGQTLDQVDLLALADRRILMIVATRDGMVHNRVVTVADSIPPDELQSLRNYLNIHFGGWLLTNIQKEIESRLRHERAAYDAILRRLNVLYERGLLDFGVAPEVHMEGLPNLIGLDLHMTREGLRELFHALEQKKRILHLLERFLEEPHGEVAVRIGLGEAHPVMEELAIIGINIPLPGGAVGKVAVLGPMRMDYERVISAVLHVGRAFAG